MKEGIKIVPLKEACLDFIVPQRDKPTAFDGNIPWCRIEDIEGRYLNGSKSGQNVTKELADKMNMHLCPKGTVISACSASIGNQAITTIDCYTNQTFIGLVVNPTLLYNVYLYYFLESQTNNLLKLGQGATIKYISKDKYKRMLIPLPSISEQQAIVSRLDAAFAKIDALKANAEKQLNDTRALFQAELSESMMPKEGWEYKKFKDISHSISDGDWIEKKDQSNTGIRLIQTGNIGVGKFIPKNDSQKFITEDTFKRLRCSEIFEGDILISRLPNPLGRTCVLPKLDTRCITAVDCSIVRIKKEVILPYFIIYYTQSQGYFSKIESESSGTTRARITRKKLEQTEIPVPPLSGQQQIVAHLDALSAKVKELEKINEQTQKECDALKQAMLREIFE